MKSANAHQKTEDQIACEEVLIQNNGESPLMWLWNLIFQELLCSTDNSIQHKSFVCSHLNDFKYRK